MPRSSEPYHAALRTAFSERDGVSVSAPAAGDPAAGFRARNRKRLPEAVVGRRRTAAAVLRPWWLVVSVEVVGVEWRKGKAM